MAGTMTTGANHVDDTRALRSKAAVTGGGVANPVESAASVGTESVDTKSVRTTPPANTLSKADLGRSDLTGLTFAGYHLGKRIGQGGMGQVYLAQHPVLGKRVAIKFIESSSLHCAEAIERFRCETAALGKIDHPNVLSAVDAGVVDGLQFLVTSFVQGTSLADELKRRGNIPWREACDWIAQAARGLEAAHQLGMVHRDIKPSNLLLDEHGIVKLIDFGLVRNSDRGDLTQAGQFLGTLDYIAPEQVGDARSCDIRSDIYSLGCTLYALLMGRPPFSGPQFETPASKIHGHLAVAPNFSASVDVSIPQPVVALLQRTLAKNPGERFASPRDVVATIDALGTAPSKEVAIGTRWPWFPPAIAGGLLIAGVVTFALCVGQASSPTVTTKSDASPAMEETQSESPVAEPTSTEATPPESIPAETPPEESSNDDSPEDTGSFIPRFSGESVISRDTTEVRNAPAVRIRIAQ